MPTIIFIYDMIYTLHGCVRVRSGEWLSIVVCVVGLIRIIEIAHQLMKFLWTKSGSLSPAKSNLNLLWMEYLTLHMSTAKASYPSFNWLFQFVLFHFFPTALLFSTKNNNRKIVNSFCQWTLHTGQQKEREKPLYTFPPNCIRTFTIIPDNSGNVFIFVV